MGTPAAFRRPWWALLILGLCMLWLGPWNSAVAICLVGLLSLGCVIVLFWKRRFVLAGMLLALSPFSVFFLQGVMDYLCGTARLRYMGLPGTQFHNLHRHYRCGKETGGCLVWGDEWVSDAPYNAAVKVMIALFGHMRGSHDGPYPTEHEAFLALTRAAEVSIEDLVQDRVILGGKTIKLDQRVGRGLLEGTEWPIVLERLGKSDQHFAERGVQEQEWLGPIKAVLWRERCLILYVPTNGTYTVEAHGASGMVVCLDTHTGRPFAYYARGGYYHRFPPVTWRE